MSPSRSNGALVLLIAASIAVGQSGVSLYLPAIPGIGSDLNIPSPQMALTLTVYFAGFAFFNLFSGPFSDVLGRRFMILRGLEVYGIGTLLCAMATDISMLMAGRTLQAFGAGVAPVVGKAMIQDTSSEDRTVILMGWLGAAMSITPAVAPFIGGIITENLRWQWTFWSLLIFNAGVWLLNFSLLTETRPPLPPAVSHLFPSLRPIGKSLETGFTWDTFSSSAHALEVWVLTTLHRLSSSSVVFA